MFLLTVTGVTFLHSISNKDCFLANKAGVPLGGETSKSVVWERHSKQTSDSKRLQFAERNSGVIGESSDIYLKRAHIRRHSNNAVATEEAHE